MSPWIAQNRRLPLAETALASRVPNASQRIAPTNRQETAAAP
ncbi:MAG TPA: hypothetical protein VHD63_20085 [Ktedonobacteraceae bacterium]|nr:hypothetical protein [Ktedonobacteraceae bacterium]